MAFPVVSLASLLVKETKEAIYATAIRIAEVIGVPVSTWQVGDPTRSLYYVEAETLSTLEEIVAGYTSSNFLDYATGVWLKIGAKQRFNVDVPEATFATSTLVLTNTGGGFYPDIEPGDLTFKSSTNEKTYRNTSGGTLASGPGTTLSIDVIADEAGSDSSAGPDEIDEMVTTLLGVEVTSSTAAVGLDEQDEAITRQQCRDKVGARSPMGSKEAYRYFARNSEITGTDAVTRVRVYGSTDTGIVTVYLAGPSGGVTEEARALVDAALLANCTPITATLQTLAATNVALAISYELWVYRSVNKTAEEIAEDVETSLARMLSTKEIGGDVTEVDGTIYKSLLVSTILSTYPQAHRVDITLPVSNLTLGRGDVATLGTVTPTIHLVVDP